MIAFDVVGHLGSNRLANQLNVTGEQDPPPCPFVIRDPAGAEHTVRSVATRKPSGWVFNLEASIAEDAVPKTVTARTV